MNRRILSGMLSLALGCGAVGCGSSGGTSGSGGSGSGSGGTTGTASGGVTGTGSGGTTTTGSGGKGSGGSGTTGSGGAKVSGSGGSATTGSGGQGTTGSGGTGTATGGSTGGGGHAPGSGGTSGGAGSGMTGSGGSTGTAGTSGANTGSVLERNNHPSRDGLFLQPQIKVTTVMGLTNKAKDAAFAPTFTNSMWASPLYAANGPNGKGAFIAVTTGNDVLAFDENDGSMLWKANIGSSPTANQSGSPTCGNIHPLGILSTPVIDATARKVYVAGAIGTSSITTHELHAISLDDGSDAKTGGWPVNVSALSAGSLTFMAANQYQNQRGALSLVGGILYATYGGHVGDCGSYHGWVVAADTSKSPVTSAAWATGGVGEAIWAPGGTASDGNGVFVMTGNNTARASTHADSEQLTRVTGMATVDKSTNANVFYPSRWMSMDGSDYDLGSVNPIYVEIPGATPSTYVVSISKDGYFYVVNSKNFGGSDGAVASAQIASSGMSIHNVPAAYVNTAGAHVIVGTDSGAKCPTGMPSGKVIMSVLIAPGSPPATPTVEWCATLGTPVTAPIVTTSSGTNDPIIWFISSGKLTGVDGSSGMVIYTSSDTCSNVRQWTSPIAVNGRIITGADGKLCSWTVH